MDKKTWFVVGLVLTTAVAVGVLVIQDGSNSPTTQTNTRPQSSEQTDMTDMSRQAVATTTVQIKNYMFDPMTIKVKAGDTVTWTNQDAVQHQLHTGIEESDQPESPELAQGQSYSFTFNKAGTYHIHCHDHPSMKQTVIVE